MALWRIRIRAYTIVGHKQKILKMWNIIKKNADEDGVHSERFQKGEIEKEY